MPKSKIELLNKNWNFRKFLVINAVAGNNYNAILKDCRNAIPKFNSGSLGTILKQLYTSGLVVRKIKDLWPCSSKKYTVEITYHLTPKGKRVKKYLKLVFLKTINKGGD